MAVPWVKEWRECVDVCVWGGVPVSCQAQTLKLLLKRHIYLYNSSGPKPFRLTSMATSRADDSAPTLKRHTYSFTLTRLHLLVYT